MFLYNKYYETLEEWPTIFFFIGLIIIVGGIVKVGLVSMLSDAMVVLTNPSPDDMFVTTTVMLLSLVIATSYVWLRYYYFQI